MSRDLRETTAYRLPAPVARCACLTSSLPDDGQLLYRPESAGAVLDMRRSTVYELIRTGRLRSVKVGRARLIPRSSIEAFVGSLSELGGGGRPG